MNQADFKKEMFSYLHGQSFNVGFLSSWFEATISQLDSLHKQQKEIKHPRHRGDAREDGICEIINNMLPEIFKTAKGYAVNSHSSMSREQDFMIMSKLHSSCLAKTKNIGYYPFHSVLASIEIKSNLDQKEIRKSLVNCASIKSLARIPMSEEYVKDLKICYSIFSFSSSKDIDKTAVDINKMCLGIPVHLRPNSIYILGAGALIPAKNGLFTFSSDQLFDDEPFAKMTGVGTQSLQHFEATAFLYFLSGIIDHCVSEYRNRTHIDLMSYFAQPLITQHIFEKILAEKNEKPLEESNVGGWIGLEER